MNPLQNLRQQLVVAWTRMGQRQRLAIGVVVAATVGVALWLGSRAWQTDYQVLSAQVSLEEAGPITKYLQAQGIAYRLENGGTTILVPGDQVQQARVGLAMEGVTTKGGKGYELLDTFSLGTPPALQHINYLRALQGELARTIMQVEPVTFARVHIVQPEPSPFIREQKPTTASVMLRLKPGGTLTRQAAAGITSLVARAVEGLTPENVTLLDAGGRLLSQAQDPDVGAVSSQLEHRNSLEKHLASKAEDMLAHALGAGRAIIRVAADINFQKVKETKESYDPEGKVIKSEKVMSQKSTNGGAKGGGRAGAASNGSDKGGSGSAGPENSQSQETTETQFALSKVIQEFEDKVGTVERLSIAALVDLSPGADAEGKPMSPKLTLQDAEELIKQAVGFKMNRDQIKVTQVQLDVPADTAPAEAEALAGQQRWQTILAIVRNGSFGLAALVVLILGLLVLRRSAAAAEPAPTPTPQEQALSRVTALAQNNPKVLARVLAGWLEQPNGAPRAGSLN